MFLEWDISRAGPFVCAPIAEGGGAVDSRRKRSRRYQEKEEQ
jgi:hypothetical protein